MEHLQCPFPGRMCLLCSLCTVEKTKAPTLNLANSFKRDYYMSSWWFVLWMMVAEKECCHLQKHKPTTTLASSYYTSLLDRCSSCWLVLLLACVFVKDWKQCFFPATSFYKQVEAQYLHSTKGVEDAHNCMARSTTNQRGHKEGFKMKRWLWIQCCLYLLP